MSWISFSKRENKKLQSPLHLLSLLHAQGHYEWELTQDRPNWCVWQEQKSFFILKRNDYYFCQYDWDHEIRWLIAHNLTRHWLTRSPDEHNKEYLVIKSAEESIKLKILFSILDEIRTFKDFNLNEWYERHDPRWRKICVDQVQFG